MSLLLLPLVFGTTLAFAGPDDDKCRQESKKAAGECKAASDAAMAQNNASSAAAGAAAGTQINKNSGSLQNEAGKQAANLDNAKKTCEEKKKQCEQKCKEAKQQASQKAQQKEAQKQDSSTERGDEAKIPKTQESECAAPIMAMMGQLGDGSKNLGQDGKSAGDTKDASQNSGMPPMQMPQGGGDDKKDTPTTTAETGTGLKCDANGTERFSDCNETYVKKCAVDMNATGCNAFANRYCNINDSGTTASSPLLKAAPSTNLVVDKVGEGIGQSFCTTVNAYRFCQVSGRASCPSCLKLNGADTSSSETLARAAGECPSDPSFITGGTSPGGIATGGTPVTGGTGNNTDRIVGGVGNTTGGGGVAGGSGSSGGLGAAKEGQAGGVLTPESLRHTASTGVGGGAGGGGADGGGGGGSPWTPPNEEEAKKDEATSEANGAGIPPLYQPARDVASKASPGLFVLGSRAYTTFCTRSQIKSCK